MSALKRKLEQRLEYFLGETVEGTVMLENEKRR